MLWSTVSDMTWARGFAAVLLVVLLGGCVATTPPYRVASAKPTAAAPTAAATFSVPATFAAACGTVSDRVAKTTATNATFLLNSPGRSPLKIAWTGNAPVDAAVPAGYLCLLLEAGVPFPTLLGSLGPYDEGFVSEGRVPATSAKPAPTGFVLPQACAFVAPPVVGTDQTGWEVDCASANNNARGALGPALMQQGWTSCGVSLGGLGNAYWKRNGVVLSVTESWLVPGDYPRLTQFARLISSCS